MKQYAFTDYHFKSDCNKQRGWVVTTIHFLDIPLDVSLSYQFIWNPAGGLQDLGSICLKAELPVKLNSVSEDKWGSLKTVVDKKLMKKSGSLLANTFITPFLECLWGSKIHLLLGMDDFLFLSNLFPSFQAIILFIQTSILLSLKWELYISLYILLILQT